MQAYGWSLPAKYSSELAEGGKSLVSVPVPVYCRPLNLNDPGMKVSRLCVLLLLLLLLLLLKVGTQSLAERHSQLEPTQSVF